MPVFNHTKNKILPSLISSHFDVSKIDLTIHYHCRALKGANGIFKSPNIIHVIYPSFDDNFIKEYRMFRRNRIILFKNRTAFTLATIAHEMEHCKRWHNGEESAVRYDTSIRMAKFEEFYCDEVAYDFVLDNNLGIELINTSITEYFLKDDGYDVFICGGNNMVPRKT